MWIATASISDVAVAVDADIAVAVTEGGDAVVVNLDGSVLGRALNNAGGPVTSLRVSQSGTVVAGGDGLVSLVDLSTGEREPLVVPGQPVTAVAVDVITGRLATGGAGVSREGGGRLGTATVFDPDGTTVFDRSWGVAVSAVSFLADDIMAVGNQRGAVLFVDTALGTIVRQLPGDGAIVGLESRQGGTELIVLSSTGVLSRWDTSGVPVAPPATIGDSASALAVSADGTQAAISTAAGIVLVDLVSGRTGGRLDGSSGLAASVVFGLHGTLVAAGTPTEGTVLWDVETGRRLGTLDAEPNAHVAFDVTGEVLILGGQDGGLWAFEVSPDHVSTLACAVAGRTLTADEWHRHLPERDNRPGCN